MTARRVLQRETEQLTHAGLDAISTQNDVDLLNAALDSHSEMFPGLSACCYHRGVQVID